MRVNVYAEEMSNRVELVQKGDHTGIRFYLYLPTTVRANSEVHQVKGPFHHKGDYQDDDSSAVTFWGKRDLKPLLLKAIILIDQHNANSDADTESPGAEKRAYEQPKVEPLTLNPEVYFRDEDNVKQFGEFQFSEKEREKMMGRRVKPTLEASERIKAASRRRKIYAKKKANAEMGRRK